MPKWKPLYSGTVPIPGLPPINIFWTSPDLHPYLLRKTPSGYRWEAYTDRALWEIYLCAGMRELDHGDAILHELEHAALSSAKLYQSVWSYEERFVGKLTPRLLPALVTMGWMPFALPRGFRALQRHAREVLRENGFACDT